MERDEANTVLVHSLRNTPSETFVLTHDVTLGWATVLIAGRKCSKTGIHGIYDKKTIMSSLVPIQIHVLCLQILLSCYESRTLLPITL